MKRELAVLASLLVAGGPAIAQTVTVTGADCSRLVQHQPAPDAAYRPGVDVRGRPVAPADLNPAPQIRVPETITIDIAVDLRRFGVPRTSPLFEPNVRLGTVTVDKEGRVSYDGQPLGDPETAALAEACRRQAGRR